MILFYIECNDSRLNHAPYEVKKKGGKNPRSVLNTENNYSKSLILNPKLTDIIQPFSCSLKSYFLHEIAHVISVMHLL